MLETGIRQFRMAMGMVWGRKLDTGNLARLVEDALATLAEFGEPGSDVQQVLDGPLHDPAARRDFINRSLRRTATSDRSHQGGGKKRIAPAAENLSDEQAGGKADDLQPLRVG